MSLRNISHYEILEPIGRGGMGVVHRARDLKLGRLAALKFLAPELLPQDDARSRFIREARSLSSLSHPHVATVYEVDDVDGKLFIAMEYLAGGTLRSKVAAAKASGTSIPEAQLLEWGLGLADGLAHVHARGIVHRDIKSSNAMFDAEGRIKLTDFGLAKVLSSPEESLSSGVAGTIQYMSPEQFGGGTVDQRSDLFSLGVVLYETATGQLPFAGATPMEVATKIMESDATPISDVRPDLPPGFELILGRLLSKAPADRYQSAQDVRDDFARLKDGRLDFSLLPTRTREIPKVVRRLGAPAFAAVAVAVVLGVAKLVGPAPNVQPAEKIVLVLPLRSIGGDADQAALCDGLTETITAALTQTRLLSVVPASEARMIDTVQQARQRFGASVVLTGSLQQRGERLRLTLNLVDAEKSRQLGVETVDVAATRAYEIEDGLMGKVAELVNVAVPSENTDLLARQASSEPKAIDAYLRGKGFLYRYDKPRNVDRALQLFEEAIQVDPDFALAYVGIAEARLGTYRGHGDASMLAAAREAVERALRLSPDLAAAHAIYGAVLNASTQRREAIVELQRAIDLDPKDTAAYRELAVVYWDLGENDEAERVYKQGIEARPGDWRAYSNLAVFYSKTERNEDAERHFRKAIEIAPDNHLGYKNLGGLLTKLNRFAEAEPLLLKALALNPTSEVASNLGVQYMLAKRYPEAVPVLEEAVRLAQTNGSNTYIVWGNLGDAHWLAGDPADKARSAYLRAIELAEQALPTCDDPAETNAALGEYFAKIGDADQSHERIATALEGSPKNAFVRYEAGIAYAMLDENARAIEELRAALERGLPLAYLETSPELSKLRRQPELRQLIEQARASS